MERVNLGETKKERTMIEEVWHNVDSSRTVLDCIEGRMGRGEYAEVLEHIGVMAMCWMVMGDGIWENLLTESEREEIRGKEPQSTLEEMARKYYEELGDGD